MKGSTPAVKVSGGYIPDLESRYFTADFNYGLCVIIQVSKIMGYRMDACESLLTWYQSIKRRGMVSLNIKSLESPINMSLRNFTANSRKDSNLI